MQTLYISEPVAEQSAFGLTPLARHNTVSSLVEYIEQKLKEGRRILSIFCDAKVRDRVERFPYILDDLMDNYSVLSAIEDQLGPDVDFADYIAYLDACVYKTNYLSNNGYFSDNMAA